MHEIMSVVIGMTSREIIFVPTQYLDFQAVPYREQQGKRMDEGAKERIVASEQSILSIQ